MGFELGCARLERGECDAGFDEVKNSAGMNHALRNLHLVESRCGAKSLICSGTSTAFFFLRHRGPFCCRFDDVSDRLWL